MRLRYSSFSLVAHTSPSLGPALVRSRGIEASVFLVASSTIIYCMHTWVLKFQFYFVVTYNWNNIVNLTVNLHKCAYC